MYLLPNTTTVGRALIMLEVRVGLAAGFGLSVKAGLDLARGEAP